MDGACASPDSVLARELGQRRRGSVVGVAGSSGLGEQSRVGEAAQVAAGGCGGDVGLTPVSRSIGAPEERLL